MIFSDPIGSEGMKIFTSATTQPLVYAVRAIGGRVSRGMQTLHCYKGIEMDSSHSNVSCDVYHHLSCVFNLNSCIPLMLTSTQGHTQQAPKLLKHVLGSRVILQYSQSTVS